MCAFFASESVDPSKCLVPSPSNYLQTLLQSVFPDFTCSISVTLLAPEVSFAIHGQLFGNFTFFEVIVVIAVEIYWKTCYAQSNKSKAVSEGG